MKIKLTVLICIATLLASLLAGCGESEPATNNTHPMEITMLTEETTEAGEITETTEPTEPPTRFEELGLKLWENCEAEGYKARMDGVDSYFSMTYGEYENFGVHYVSTKNQTSTELIKSEVVDADFNVRISEFTSEFFEDAMLDSIITNFRRVDAEKNGKNVSRADWLAAHEDYKILWVQTDMTVYTEELVKADIAAGNYYTYWVNGLEILDMNTGVAISATSQNSGAGVFCIEHDGKEHEVFAEHIINLKFREDGNGQVNQDMYVMVPEEYDEIAFFVGEGIVPYTEEKLADARNQKYTETWEVINYYDELTESNEFYKNRFFTILPYEE